MCTWCWYQETVNTDLPEGRPLLKLECVYHPTTLRWKKGSFLYTKLKTYILTFKCITWKCSIAYGVRKVDKYLTSEIEPMVLTNGVIRRAFTIFYYQTSVNTSNASVRSNSELPGYGFLVPRIQNHFAFMANCGVMKTNLGKICFFNPPGYSCLRSEKRD